MRSLLLLLLLLPLIAGCDRKEEKTADQPPPGKVIADDAYRQYFGSPPTPRAGTAWVRVGFLPRNDGSGSLSPFPLFFYRQDGQLQLLLDQLTGENLRLPKQSGLFNPFPPGSRAVAANLVAGKREINLTLPAGADADPEIMAAVLVETAGRFPGVKQVVLTLNGAPWPGMPADGFDVPTGRVIEPGPPRPLVVLADFSRGGDHPAELLVNFDRPMKLESFRLSTEDGREVAGDYFQSVFGMAVVIHPKNPELLTIGQPVRISWKATDAKGRKGTGEVLMPVTGRGKN